MDQSGYLQFLGDVVTGEAKVEVLVGDKIVSVPASIRDRIAAGSKLADLGIPQQRNLTGSDDPDAIQSNHLVILPAQDKGKAGE
ncbi:MAG TPA: hypothetical protein PK876_00300 [Elusimicrobiota bacterium]|nr:hypothetical protein [Elusimicrobiota bacterium]